MKILHCVESYFPSKGGMQEVVMQLSERLVLLGHEVTVATRKLKERNFSEKEGVQIVDFEISGNLVAGIVGEKEKYRRFLLDNDFDIITFFAAQQWATDLALDILPQIKAKKVAVPTGYSAFYRHEFKDYFEKMRSWIKHYDMNVYLSNDYRDINFARENNVSKIIIIPNGAAENEFLPESETNIRELLGIPKDNKIVLLVGSYTGRKGHREAVEIYLRSKLKNVTLLMIGNDYEKFYRQYFKHPLLGVRFIVGKILGKKVIFNSFSREFTVAAYKQSNVFLFPSNIECSPIVLFECAAAKLPFISTDVGNSQEIAEWTKGGVIAETLIDENRFSHVNINNAVNLLENLIGDDIKRKQIGNDAFAAWQNKFMWEKIVLQYQQMYLSLLK